MPYPDGTLTADDHAATAAKQLAPSTGHEGDHLDVFQSAVVDALRGIGHALLAIHAEMQVRRAEGARY